MNLGNSSIPTLVILLNSGNLLFKAIGFFTKLLIEKLRSSDPPQLFCGSHLRTLARKENAMILSINGRWPSKYQVTKVIISWNFLTMKIIHLNWSTLIVEYSSNTLVTQICYVLELQEQSLTMYQSAIID